MYYPTYQRKGGAKFRVGNGRRLMIQIQPFACPPENFTINVRNVKFWKKVRDFSPSPPPGSAIPVPLDLSFNSQILGSRWPAWDRKLSENRKHVLSNTTSTNKALHTWPSYLWQVYFARVYDTNGQDFLDKSPFSKAGVTSFRARLLFKEKLSRKTWQ